MRSVLATITVALLAVTPLNGETAAAEQNGWNWNNALTGQAKRPAEHEPPQSPYKTWFPTVKPGSGLDESEDGQEPPDGSAPIPPIDKELKVRRGDTFEKVLNRGGVPSPDTAGAIRALKKVYDLRRLQPGTEIFLQLQPPAAKKGAETLLSIDFIADGDVEISVLRNGPQSFAAKRFDRTLVPKVSYGRGVVRSSLYVAGKDAKIPAAILANLVGLYSFDVDFQRDVQPGDSFEVLYERLTDEAGEPVREGDIVVASMTLTGSTTTLYRFKTKTGFSDYFDENGQSAQKSLLRTPTDAARISSGFGRRKHPILGYNRMHRGIDFAAPPGTPVYAAGDGVIEKAGWAGAYGRYIRIRHNGNYKTAYAHLRRIAAGVKAGTRIKQRQVIGYIGASGRVTGPHLHYEVLFNGRHINPRKIRLAAGYKLKGKDLARFKAGVADAKHKMLTFRTQRKRQATMLDR